MPMSYVSKIEMTFLGETISVPLTAFASLSEVTEANLTAVDGKYLLRIVGGESGSGGYVSELRFRRDDDAMLLIESQRTFWRTIPDDAYEEVIYSFPRTN